MMKLLMESLCKYYSSYGRVILITIILSLFYQILKGQTIHPDLGLNGNVIWLNDTRIRVEYDWTDDAQLLDWSATNGSSLIRGNGVVNIAGGVASVRSMVWKQLMRCTRIYAQDAQAINSPNAHLNFITNVSGWTGYNFNPPGIIGAIYISNGNIWVENEGYSSLPAPAIVLGTKYTVEINISETSMTARSSSDNNTYSYNLTTQPDFNRQVAVGGWGGDTEWGKLIIEGEVDITWQTPADMIEIQSGGALFSPVIEVTGNPVIEWIFDDGTTSSSTSPVKNYGSIGVRHNLLRVTPWSALTGINVGYDATDGGYGGFAIVDKQNILVIKNLSLAKASLKYLCASYSPLVELDLTEFNALAFVELLSCQNLAILKLGSHPLLERLCVEDCNLLSLNLSGCPDLGDFRGANNRYTSIEWGTTGSHIWHICVRSNPQFTVNLPDLGQFPLLRELLIWDCNQTGMFECHSSDIIRVDAYDNHYTAADISGCTSLVNFSLSGSKLTSLNLGIANNLKQVLLKDCNLNESLTDYVLQTIDGAGQLNGLLELTGNSAPSLSGMVHFENLKSKGWTVTITEPGQLVNVTGINITGEGGVTAITTYHGTLQLYAEVFPVNATDKTVTWSITNGSEFAAVDETGLVTAMDNGTITVRATANDNSGFYDELIINISNQIEPGENGDYSSLGKIIVGTLELSLELNKDYTSWKAELYNLNGSLVSQKFVESNLLLFDISKLAPGMHLIILSKNIYQIRTAKFIKP